MSFPCSFATLTLGEARHALAASLFAAGREPASLDARLLLEAATGLTHAQLLRLSEAPLAPDAAQRLAELATRRLRGEPTSRLLGERVFCGLVLQVSADVLDPREDTETLVHLACDLRPARAAIRRLLDLGTGSGALLCGLLRAFPQADGVGVDRSPAACMAARMNVAENDFAARGSIVRGNWADAVAAPFDLIVANPPYIATGDLAQLPDEVRCHDPPLALDGGFDGLDAYRAILGDVRRVASPRALLVFELGAGMRPAVQALTVAAGLDIVGVARDGGGHERALAAEVL